MKKYVKIKMFMPSEKGNISKFNQYMKSAKMLYINYIELESSIKK